MSTILSIIVPVYKVENYLESCVYSIINQTLTNFELILVDDGSPDRSSEICDQLGKTDDRIKVVHKDNGGVSSARNIGLNLASGKWVTFIDADDCISPNFIEGLFAPIFDDNSEVQFVQGGCKCWDGLSNYRVEQSYIDYCSNNPENLYSNFRGLIVSKLFLREIIDGSGANKPIRFDENMSLAEDMLFTLEYIARIDKYAFVKETGYFYRQNNQASLTKGKKRRSLDSEFYSFRKIYNANLEYINTKSIKCENARFRYEQMSRNFWSLLYSLRLSSLSHGQRLILLNEEIIPMYGKLLNYLSFRPYSIDNLLLLLLKKHKFKMYNMITSSMFFLKNLIDK